MKTNRIISKKRMREAEDLICRAQDSSFRLMEQGRFPATTVASEDFRSINDALSEVARLLEDIEFVQKEI